MTHPGGGPTAAFQLGQGWLYEAITCANDVGILIAAADRELAAPQAQYGEQVDQIDLPEASSADRPHYTGGGGQAGTGLLPAAQEIPLIRLPEVGAPPYNAMTAGPAAPPPGAALRPCPPGGGCKESAHARSRRWRSYSKQAGTRRTRNAISVFGRLVVSLSAGAHGAAGRGRADRGSDAHPAPYRSRKSDRGTRSYFGPPPPNGESIHETSAFRAVCPAVCACRADRPHVCGARTGRDHSHAPPGYTVVVRITFVKAGKVLATTTTSFTPAGTSSSGSNLGGTSTGAAVRVGRAVSFCWDGTHSNGTGSGACSHHGGVDH